MRLLLIVAIVTVFCSSGYGHPLADVDDIGELEGFIDDLINKTIQAIRDALPDPISIPEEQITFPPSALINGTFKVDNFNAYGVKGFSVPVLKVDGLLSYKLNMSFLFSSININTDYMCDLLFAELLPAYGEGKANVHVSNLVFSLSSALSLKTGFSNMSITLDVDEITFDIHGMLNNEAFSLLVSAVLNDVVETFIREEKELISSIISPIVQNVINAIMFPPKTTTAAPSTTPTPKTTKTPSTTKAPVTTKAPSTTIASTAVPTKAVEATPLPSMALANVKVPLELQEKLLIKLIETFSKHTL